MWYKNDGLIYVIVASPEKKMSQQPYPMTADSLLWFSGSYNQSLFSPLYPLVCAILPWTSPQVNFLFLAFFLLVPYFRYSFQRSKNNLLGGLVAPSFSHFQNFATQNASKYRKIKGLLGGEEVCPPNSSNLAKSTTFSEMPLTSGFLAHVPRCDRPCCPFPAGLGDIPWTEYIGSLARCKMEILFQNPKKSQGRKVCRLKVGWLYATWPEGIARQSRANT